MSTIQLYIKSSNSLNALVHALLESLRLQKKNVFQPVYIITQTEGMSSWLKMRMAEEAGIAANIKFLKPNDLINKIYFAAEGKYESTLSSTDMQWLIYRELIDEKITGKFPLLSSYYTLNGRTDNVKRIALAREVADLFDQYQVYRPEMLRMWEDDRLATNHVEEKWQSTLWKKISAEAGKALPDKNRIKDTIIKNLVDPHVSELFKNKIPVIYFFGTSLVTSFHHDILLAVSAYIPVHLFLPNPAPDIYWYEDKSQKALFYERKKGMGVDDATVSNPLLINWGKLIQNTFQLFFKNDETIDLYEEVKVSQDGQTLLAGVQHLICENNIAGRDDLYSDEKLQDGSISIQSCFSPAREVETLYNFLVKLIDEHPGKYSTRDVVVHVTDINRYASYIRSVFDNAPHKLKYSIADESYTASDTISQALYTILTLDKENFTSESVMQLLNFSSVRRHFKINDVTGIREVVQQANICHSIEGDSGNDSVYVSWQYGLRRIMYGICISGAQEYGEGHDSFFPLDTIEGNDANEVIRFVYMVEKLIAVVQARADERTVPEWADHILEVMRILVFDEEQKDNQEYHELIEKVNSMVVDDGLFNEKVSFKVFLMQFLPALNEISQGYKFARGGITFCSLIPMRSIPFKIVAMLGLDFDKFPRKPKKSGFDLMAKDPKPGDRNIKVNDKHLFLETLLSAGDYLYMSYIGQRINDNTKRPPSIMIDDLLSFIESSSLHPAKAKKALLKEQPLHGFSAKYGNEPGYFNYLLSKGNAAKIATESAEEQSRITTVNLNELFRFLSDPIADYYKKSMGIYFENETVTLPETEKFSLDHLEKWNLKNQLLLTDDQELDVFIDLQKKTGTIPLKSAGTYEVLTALEEIKGVKECFDEERDGLDPRTEHVEIGIGQFQLSATISNVFGEKVLAPCFSKNPTKYYLRAWLISLVVSAAGKALEVVFIGDEKKYAEPLSQKNALKKLENLIRLMQIGREELMLFNIGWFSSVNEVDEKKLNQKIKKCAETDPYLALAINDGLPEDLLQEYMRVAEKILPQINEAFKLDNAK